MSALIVTERELQWKLPFPKNEHKNVGRIPFRLYGIPNNKFHLSLFFKMRTTGANT